MSSDEASPGRGGGPPHESGVREAVCRVGRALHRAGLVAGTAGNLSVRLDRERVLVTPRGVRKDQLVPGGLVVLGLARPDPRAVAQATTEWPAHRACYRADPGVGAVLHSHAPALTAVGLRGLDLTEAVPEVEAAVGRIVEVPFAPGGTEELATLVGEAVASGGRVVLLLRHGVLVVGRTLDEAFDRTELAELTARAVVWGGGGGP